MHVDELQTCMDVEVENFVILPSFIPQLNSPANEKKWLIRNKDIFQNVSLLMQNNEQE